MTTPLLKKQVEDEFFLMREAIKLFLEGAPSLKLNDVALNGEGMRFEVATDVDCIRSKTHSKEQLDKEFNEILEGSQSIVESFNLLKLIEYYSTKKQRRFVVLPDWKKVNK
jgi:hypothetical protein